MYPRHLTASDPCSDRYPDSGTIDDACTADNDNDPCALNRDTSSTHGDFDPHAEPDADQYGHANDDLDRRAAHGDHHADESRNYSAHQHSSRGRNRDSSDFNSIVDGSKA